MICCHKSHDDDKETILKKHIKFHFSFKNFTDLDWIAVHLWQKQDNRMHAHVTCEYLSTCAYVVSLSNKWEVPRTSHHFQITNGSQFRVYRSFHSYFLQNESMTSQAGLYEHAGCLPHPEPERFNLLSTLKETSGLISLSVSLLFACSQTGQMSPLASWELNHIRFHTYVHFV